MQKIIIDEEFKALLPALDKETYGALEQNLLQNGCRDSLVVWGDVLVDGHNRYEICMKHGIAFSTVTKEFSSREDALIWIISTQVARRNLSPMQLSHYRGLHYRADKKIRGAINHYTEENKKSQNDTFKYSTASRLAKQYNVSRATINRDAKVAVAIDAIGETSPEAKRKILSGEVPLKKQKLGELADANKTELAKIASQIQSGTYKAETPASKGGGAVGSRIYTIASISEIMVGFRKELRKFEKSDDVAEFKARLRAFIDALDEVYRKL